MSGTLWMSGGSSTGVIIKVYVYPDNSSQDNECENAISNALADMGHQLIDHGAIDGYKVFLNWTHPQKSGDDSFTYFNNFNEWRVANHTETGVHVGVKGSFKDGRAKPGECCGCTSFTTDNSAVVGTGTAKETFKNTSIQEALHPYIRSKLSADGENDHQLGRVYWSNSVSPMATGYEDSEAGKGTCASSYTRLGWSTSMTNCTKDAVKTTGNNEL